MPTPPDLPTVLTYLGTDSSWASEEVESALAAETAAQARVVKFPPDPDAPAEPLPYPADLAEALCRRVAHNLALRALPLGVQATISEMAVATTSVGGTDAEVRRLERPHRKLVIG
jgi:hypothetical protein